MLGPTALTASALSICPPCQEPERGQQAPRRRVQAPRQKMTLRTPPHRRETRPEDSARQSMGSKAESGVAHIALALVQQRTVRTPPPALAELTSPSCPE